MYLAVGGGGAGLCAARARAVAAAVREAEAASGCGDGQGPEFGVAGSDHTATAPGVGLVVHPRGTANHSLRASLALAAEQPHKVPLDRLSAPQFNDQNAWTATSQNDGGNFGTQRLLAARRVKACNDYADYAGHR